MREEDSGQFRSDFTSASAQWTISTAQIGDGRVAADGSLWQGHWRWSSRSEEGERIALSPERLLITAAAAADLRMLPDEVRWQQRLTVVGFTWGGMPARILLDPNLHLPSRIEIVRGGGTGRLEAMLGDATYATDYSF